MNIRPAPWYRELNSYQWYVLIVASLGWLFDTMVQQIFVIVKTPALKDLLNDTGLDATLYSTYATSIFLVGWATGGLIFGMFSDRWGRARTMLLTIVIFSVFTGLSALATSWWDFAAYRFLCGMGVGGEFAAGVALVAEVMPARARPFALGLLQALSAVGNLSAVAASFLIRPQMQLLGLSGWRWLFLVGLLPILLVLAVRKKLKEPDSWIHAQAALKLNTGGDEAHRQLGDMREMFTDPRWRHHTLVGVLLAVAGVVGVWGIAFWTPELIRNNVLANEPPAEQDWYASVGLVLQNTGAFLGIYAYTLLAARLGRRIAFAIGFIAAFASVAMVYGFMTHKSQILWMIPILGFCTLMPFAGFAIYFPELYPTRLRSTGTGFCYNVARYLAAGGALALGMLATLFLAVEGTARHAAGLSDWTLLSALGGADNAFRYAALAVALIYPLALLVLPFAPETRDKPLPE